MRLSLLLLFALVIISPRNGSCAADKPCQYTETSLDVGIYEKKCSFNNSDDSDCSFQISYTVSSDCMRPLEVFYACQAVIEFSPAGFFSTAAKARTDKIGSVVIRDGKGAGTIRMHWKPLNAAENIKITQANCYVTETYPLDAQ